MTAQAPRIAATPPESNRRPGRGSPVRVLVVDPDRRVRRSLGNLFGACDEVVVVGSTDDATAAEVLLRSARPDVVILDPRIPDLDAGLVLIASIRSRPSTRVLLLGWPDDEGPVPDGDDIRVLGPSADPVELVEAICGSRRSGEQTRC